MVAGVGISHEWSIVLDEPLSSQSIPKRRLYFVCPPITGEQKGRDIRVVMGCG